jgi:hypothetical protein
LINEAGLKQDLSVLAGPEMEGRETGMAGQRKAAAYIASRMKAIGLTPVPGLANGYEQYYFLLKESLISAGCRWGNKDLQYGEDFIFPVAQNQSFSLKANKIFFIGYGIQDPRYSDYLPDEDYRNSILILVPGEPKIDGKYLISGTDKPGVWTQSGLKMKLEAAKKAGAAAVLLLSPNQEKISARSIEHSKKSSRFIINNEEPEKAAYAQISHQVARSFFGTTAMDSLISLSRSLLPLSGLPLVRRINDSIRPVEVILSLEKKTDTIKPSNVIGMLEGNRFKDEYVFITAHYDHLGIQDNKIYYGADDDGSGTAAVLQLAAAFAKAKSAGKGPERSIVFMTVSGEEKGLLGSEYYSEHPLLPLEKTSADLNIDMIGRIDTERKLSDTNHYVYVIGHDKISTELGKICEISNAASGNITLDYKFDDPNDPQRIYFRSDHYNFARKGVPVLFFYDGMLLGDYHKPTDTIDKINWELYVKRTKMIFTTAWNVANSDHLMQRDLPIPTMTR